MKMKNLYLIIVLLVLKGGVFAQVDTTNYSEAFHLIEVWLEAQRDYEQIPGITAAIVKDQDILWSGAFGMANVEENVKAEASTLCGICSISKLFTAIAIMKLYEDDKLRLDDEIGDLLPWYNLEQQYPKSGPITIRSLLTHSSGLPRENSFSHWNGPDFSFPTQEQIKSTLSTQKTLYPVSTYYQYSNLAFVLLGEVVEEGSGESFNDYINRNILEPLGLNDTRTTMPKSLYGSKLAVGYSIRSRDGERKKLNFFQARGVKSAAGFSSNVMDLAKFASWQFRLRDAVLSEVLKPSTIKYMQKVHWTEPGWENTRGLGFGVYEWTEEDKWVGHSGYCPGYQSILRLNLNSKHAYALMVNANGINIEKYVNGMHALLTKSKSKEDQEKTDRVNLEQYTGYFEWDILTELYISTWDGKLAMLNIPTDSPAEALTLFKNIEGDTFRRIREDGELGETLKFERNEDGNIYQLKWFDNWIFTKVQM